MSGIEHISSPYSENWVYWVFLLLLALMFLNQSIKNSMIVAFRTISSHSDRVYGGQNSNILGVLTAWVFRIALFALVIYMVSFDGGDFTFGRYLIILVVIGAVCFVQYILTLGIGWVFVARKDLDNGLGQIEIVRNCIGVMLLPMPLWMIVVDNSLLSWILLGIIGGFFIILMLVKSLQLFYKNILSLLYILLYLICLEIIPLGGIVLWTQHILQ